MAVLIEARAGRRAEAPTACAISSRPAPRATRSTPRSCSTTSAPGHRRRRRAGARRARPARQPAQPDPQPHRHPRGAAAADAQGRERRGPGVLRPRRCPASYPDVGDVDACAAHLRTLGEHDLVQLDRAEEEAYAFKHVVTQEAAYESMPFALRARLHVRVGTLPGGDQPDASTATSTCWRTTSGSATTRSASASYLLRAGEAAQAAYANEAAIDYFERLGPLLEGAERVQALLRLGDVLALVGSWDRAEDGRHRVARARGVRRRATARRAGPRRRSPRSPASTAATRTRARTWSAPRRASPPPARTTAPGASCTSPARSPPSAGDSTSARAQLRGEPRDPRAPRGRGRHRRLYSNLGVVAEYDGDYDAARELQRARAGACASRSAIAGASASRRRTSAMIATYSGALGGRRRALRGGDAPEPRDRRRLDGRHRPQQPRQLRPRAGRPRAGAHALRGEPGRVRGLRRPLGAGLPAGGHRRLAADAGAADGPWSWPARRTRLREEIGAARSPALEEGLGRRLRPARRAARRGVRRRRRARAGRARDLAVTIEMARRFCSG